MTKPAAPIILCLCCVLFLTACSNASLPQTAEAPTEPVPLAEPKEPEQPPAERQDTEANSGSEQDMPSGPEQNPSPIPGTDTGQEPSLSPAPSPSPSPAASAPVTDEEIGRRYAEAIASFQQTVTLDITGREWKYGAENDLKNIYYKVLSENSELKYAYDMTAAVTDSAAECSFFYMPYKTGAYTQTLPPGSHTVGSLHDAAAMAQSMIRGTERLSIAITDPSLGVEDLQRAVRQAGYGWIDFSLSRDGTEILASSFLDMTLSDCIENINESFRLAAGIVDEIIEEEMTDREKAEAAYHYITEKVAYDFRYYSGKNDMPFVSTVALGALRDHLAICGGYSHALEMLLDVCGIENYTVSGISGGEYHAWNYVILDGTGYYCDPTADRGGMNGHFLLTADELENMGGYEWDADFYRKLCRTSLDSSGSPNPR